MKRRAGDNLAPRLIAVAVASCFASAPTWGNPTGAQVVNGTVGFARPNASTLKITNSPGAIINWQGFSIGAGEVTRFIQQSASSAVLNRVVGADISSIQGQLLSNGRVFLINPSGIVVGPGAVIDTAGFVGSTLAMQNADFLAGKLKFQGDASSGRIVNQGWIRTGQGGQVMLVAPQIENSGLIHTPKGELILAAGRKLTISSLDHDGVQFEVQAPTDTALNVGKLLAEGGTIGVFAGTLKHSGEIRATSLALDATGQIVLKAQKDIDIAAGSITSASGVAGGKVQVQSGDTTLVSGSIEARGGEGKGGTIHVLGDKVGLLDHARVDVSGETGGGTVLVGGDFQGKNPVIQNAFRAYAGPDVIIKADAVTNGDGGKVIVWADDATRFYGGISARGGAMGGNGGFAEVSGKGYLDYRGHADLSAPAGATGVLFLDPNDVEIRTDVASGGGTFGGGDPNIFGGGATTSQILWNTIKTNLTTADVHITTTGTQGVNGDITVVHNSPDLATAHTLRLLAHNNVTLNGGITNTGGGALGLYAGWDGNNGTPGVNAGAGQVFLNAPIAYTGNVFLHAGEDINQAVGASIGANSLLARSAASFVHLDTATNSVTTLAGEAKSEFRFKNDRSLTIGSVTDPAAGITVQGVTVDATGIGGKAEITITTLGPNSDLTVNKNVTAVASGSTTNAVISLTAGRHLTVTGSSISATATNAADIGGTATVTLTANTGNITLNSSNISATGGDATSAGAASVTLKADTGSIMVNNSMISATGGNGGTSGCACGASATVTLQADAGNITVGSGSALAATGGGGSDAGGAATVTLNAALGGITVDSSSITATGGAAANATGGAATAELLAQTSLDIHNSAITANAGGGFIGGAATVTLEAATGGMTINSNSNIAANGGAGGSGDGGSALANLTGASVTLDSSSVAATGGDSAAGTNGGAATVVLTATGSNINFIGSDVTATGGAASQNGAAGLDIIAGQGAILQSGGGVLQVGPSGSSSNFIDLQARDGIGTTGAPIRVASGFGSLNVNNAGLFSPGSGNIVVAQTTGDVNLSSATYTFTNGASNGGIDVEAVAGSVIVPAGFEFKNAHLLFADTGAVTLRASDAIVLQSGGPAGAVTSNTNVTFVADRMDIQGPVTANGGAGMIVLRTLTPNHPVDLGATLGVDPGTGLALANAELGQLSAQQIRIVGGEITQTGAVTFTGAANFNAGANPVTLNDPGNDFMGVVRVTGSNVTLRDMNGIDLGASTVSGNLTVTAAGAITDSGALAVGGATQLTAGAGNNITLNNGNDFGGAVRVVSGNNVVLNDVSGIDLEASTVSGNLTVTVVGAITDSGALTVAGTTQLTAGAGNNITLNNANNFGGAVRVISGNNVSLNDVSGIDLGASTVSGNLTVTAAGAITDSGALAVGGATQLTAGAGNNITLNNANNFGGAVRVISGNNVTLNDTNALTLGALNVGGNLRATATGALKLGQGGVGGNLTATSNGGAITQGGALTIGGRSNINAGVGAIALATAGNDFTGAVSLNNGAGNILVSDANAIKLGASNVGTGTLTVNAVRITQSGPIQQSAGAGAATFNGGAGAITLNNASNLFTGPVVLNTSGATDASIVNSGNLKLGDSAIGGNFTATASGAGSVIDLAGALTVGGLSTLTASQLNVGGSLHSGGTINANVTNSGNISPGSSPGILTINGNYTQGASGTLNMEIGGTIPGPSGHDQLVVTGMATLGGTLNASLINGFIPAPADSFTLIQAGSVTGAFATTNLPAGTLLAPSYLVSSFVVSTPPSPGVTTPPLVPPIVVVEIEKHRKAIEEGPEKPGTTGPSAPICR